MHGKKEETAGHRRDCRGELEETQKMEGVVQGELELQSTLPHTLTAIPTRNVLRSCKT